MAGERCRGEHIFRPYAFCPASPFTPPGVRAGSAGFQPALFSLLRCTSTSRLSPRREIPRACEPGALTFQPALFLPRITSVARGGSLRRSTSFRTSALRRPDLGEVVRSGASSVCGPGEERRKEFSNSHVLAYLPCPEFVKIRCLGRCPVSGQGVLVRSVPPQRLRTVAGASVSLAGDADEGPTRGRRHLSTGIILFVRSWCDEEKC